MSSPIGQAVQFGGASLNLGVRILYIPAAILSWLAMIAQSWRTLLTLVLLGGVFYGVGIYGGQVISTVINVMNTEIAPIYVNTVRPVLSGIIRDFFNRAVCWFDGYLMFPYLVGRNAIFPILRNGGFGTAVSAFVSFCKVLGRDFFLGYFASGKFLSQEFNYNASFTSWQVFFTDWQLLWCYGC